MMSAPTTTTSTAWDVPRLREAARDGAALVAAHGEGRDYLSRVELSEAVLRWAHNTFGDGLTTASSMGDEALVDLVGRTIGEADVFFLDTGYHFPETLATRVTGMRRVDAPTRTDIEVVSFDEKRQMVKVNPLAAWDDEDLETYVFHYDVHLNPLRQQGYASIGCAPCTRPVAPGEDARAGRWAGQDKVECGLHT